MTRRMQRVPSWLAFGVAGCACSAAFAQSTVPAADRSDLILEEIVVTGTTASNRTKLESSVAITTVDSDKLTRIAPASLADSLHQVPGLWVEDSGGEVSNNVAPRGLSGGAAFSFISLQEDGLPVLYDGELVDVLLRQDVTIERFEAIRGGTSAILSTNGPASIINFITRRGSDQPEGIIKATIASYNSMRGDFFYGGPLAENWRVGFGGYYRNGDGVRDIGMTADHGGQVRLNLTRDFDGGYLSFGVKHIDDHNTFYLPIPLTNEGNPKGVPGVDPNYGTLDGPDVSNIVHHTAGGDIVTSLNEGFATKGTTFGVDFLHDLGNNWTVRSNGRLTQYDVAPNSVFNGPNSWLVTAANRTDPARSADVADMLARFAPQGAVRAGLAYVDTGELISNPGALNGNGFVTDSVAETRYRSVEHFVEQLSFSHETDRNSFSTGMLYVAQTLNRDADYGGRIVTELRDRPRRLDIVALDGSDNVVGYLTDKGLLRNGYFYENHNGDMRSYSLYANDEFHVNEQLRVDAGVRHERVNYHVRDEQTLVAGDTAPGSTLVGGTPIVGALNDDGTDKDNVIANNYLRRAGTGNFISAENSYDETAWTLGFNYRFGERIAMYGRYADGFQTPTLFSADNITDTGTSRLRFSELGARYVSPWFVTSLTLFHTQFDNLSFGETDQATGNFRQVFVETLSTGLEWELTVNLGSLFSIEGVGVIQDATIDGIDPNAVESAQNGNQVLRTPNIQVRLTPTVHLPFGDVFVVYSHIGKRYADFENQLALPAYQVLDLGAEIPLGEQMLVNLKVNNLTNEIGLTEGNPRSGFNQSANENFYYARPILGRHGTLSFTYRF